jgi:glycosyltransferase involved in cell wall biosynthesis
LIKGLYICEEFASLPGIEKKILSQIRLMEQNLGAMELVKIKYSFFEKLKNKLPYFSANYNQLKKIIPRIKEFNFIYIRKPSVLTKKFIQLINKVKELNPNIIILMEIPTYPYDNEIKMTLKNVFSLRKDKYWRDKLKPIDRIVTFSKDKIIFGIKTITISNGVDFNRVPLKNNNLKNNTIDLIGVASISEWHGYDRIITGMKNYENTNSHIDVKFHIVGDGNQDVLNTYRNMVKEYNLSDKVIFHGKLTGKDLDRVFDISDIGVDALGRHRSNVYYNSSLKGKEYLARGVPIISGVETELDDMKEFEAYMRVSANDNSIDITEVIQFYLSVLMKNIHPKDIREFGEQNFDFGKTMIPVIKFLSNRSK